MPGARASQAGELCRNCGGYHVRDLDQMEARGGRLCWCSRCGCKRLLKQMALTPEGIRRLASIKGYPSRS